MDCKCDKCTKVFTVQTKEKFVSIRNKDLFEIYFICPHCNTKYNCYYEDNESKENLKKLKNLQTKYNNTPGLTKRQKANLKSRIRRLKDRRKQQLDKLKLYKNK